MEKVKLSEAGLLLPEVSVFGTSVSVDNHYTDGQLLAINQVPSLILQDEINTEGLVHLSAEESLNTNLDVDTSSGQVQYIILQRDGQILELQAPAAGGAADLPVNNIEDQQMSHNEGVDDKLECGMCGHVCHSLLQFLSHKTSHVGKGRGLGCEICNLSFSRQLSLSEHYRRKHKIDLRAKKPEKVKPNKTKSFVQKAIKPLVVQSNVGVVPNVDISDVLAHGEQTRESNEGKTDIRNPAAVETCIEIVENKTVSCLNDVEQITEHSEDYLESCNVRDPNEYLNQTSESKEKREVGALSSSVIVEEERVLDECEASVAHLLEYQQSCDKHNVSDEAPVALAQEPDAGFSAEDASGVVPDKTAILEADGSSVPGVEEEHEAEDVELGNVQSEQEPAALGDEISEEKRVDSSIEEVGNSDLVSRIRKRRRAKLNVDNQNTSEGSEKENTEGTGENGKFSTNSDDSKKMRKVHMRKVDATERSSEKLLAELDMPDFHFIASVQESGKKPLRGGKYYFKCLYCELKMSWRTTMCRHMREKHADILKVGSYLAIPSQITETGERLMKMSEYVQHERTGKTGKRTRGIETQDLPGNFPCEKCGKVFHRLRYLKKHLVYHRPEKNHLCSMCVKTFKTLASLNQHMKSHKDREPYKCNQCDFVSTFNIAIHGHRQIHRQGCVICEICGSAYTDKSTLTKHKHVHDQSRPFPCPHPGCTWRFKTKSMCNAHFRAHSSKGKFECRVCKYAFRQKHHLIRHEKSIHNIMPDRQPSYRYMTDDMDSCYNNDSMQIGAHEKVTVVQTENPCPDEVSMIIDGDTSVCVDGVHDQFDLESALQSGHLVIATDDGSTINYEMSDLSMTGAYQTLLHDGDSTSLDSHTILIPQVGSHVVYQHEEVTETIVTDEHLESKDTDSS